MKLNIDIKNQTSLAKNILQMYLAGNLKKQKWETILDELLPIFTF